MVRKDMGVTGTEKGGKEKGEKGRTGTRREGGEGTDPLDFRTRTRLCRITSSSPLSASAAAARRRTR